jgi:hypothetical protein
MRRRIGRLAMAMAMAIAVLGIPWASPATASPAIASPALASTYGGCSLTVARPVRLALYIHAWATLHCTGNVTPSSILIDLGYPTYFWSTSVMRQWYAVPANVNQSFGLLYACPGGTGGTNRTWSLDASAFIKYPLFGKVATTEYDVSGPAATFRC